MNIDFIKLIIEQIPFILRREAFVEFLVCLCNQINQSHNIFLGWGEAAKQQAAYSWQTIYLERLLTREFGVPFMIEEADGKPTDFNVLVGSYVDEKRLRAVIDKYKLAGRSYNVIQNNVSLSARFINPVCERYPAVWKAKFINPVCEREDSATIVKFLNHVCERKMIVHIKPGEVTYGGSSPSELMVNIVFDPVEDVRTDLLTINYTLWGCNDRGVRQTAVANKTVKGYLDYYKDFMEGWNRLDNYWVPRYAKYELVINSISPTEGNLYFYEIKNK